MNHPSALAQRIARFPFLRLFAQVRGNARVIVLTEGISNVIFQWISTYLPLYMLAMGLNEVSIGWLASVSLLTQFFSTLAGGYCADRFGRKRVLVVGDIFFWSGPFFLFGIAAGPLLIVIGRLINGFVNIVFPSFECLFVEDVPVENRPAVYGSLQFLMALGSLLAPVSGILVAQLGMVGAGRVMLFAAAAVVAGVAILRQFTLTETSVGSERMSAVQRQPAGALLADYRQALFSVFANGQARSFLIARILINFCTVIWGTYAMIYLTAPGGGKLAESMIAVLPTAAALVTLGAVLFSAERFSGRHIFGNLVTGQLLWLAGALVFAFSPAKNLAFPILWTLLNAVSLVLTQPAGMSYWANLVEERQRAVIFSSTSALITLCSLPAGPLAGVLYLLWPKAPFLLAIGLQLLVLVLILTTVPRGMKAAVAAGPAN